MFTVLKYGHCEEHVPPASIWVEVRWCQSCLPSLNPKKLVKQGCRQEGVQGAPKLGPGDCKDAPGKALGLRGLLNSHVSLVLKRLKTITIETSKGTSHYTFCNSCILRALERPLFFEKPSHTLKQCWFDDLIPPTNRRDHYCHY